ncbi:hypothetical protein GCM10010964_43360 [Caldovatus sediminis]|uniref:Uncharacterized protein n=1 Tax=Caldovatus sediminis TaxID=2041189 RepID=A0A8J2ZFI7_9PROT|nr:hypothetical protein [Caldovatus sediminis]GGG51478.1 hypothetical protein GCM10010964_43360 [Caldovatus sediminis]
MPDTAAAAAAPTLDLTKLDALGPLKAGAHPGPDAGACVMEALSYVAGEPWSDSPDCCCPVIAAFLRAWNDGLPDDERDALLRPLIPRLVGTRATPAVERRRALLAADWMVREHTPAWLRPAGLTAQADALAGLPEITDVAQVPSIRSAIEAAQRDAAAAWDAAWAAAGAAAWAARAAARAAAWDAARAAARAAAWDAARVAAWVAAGDAAWAAAGAAAWAARAAAWDAARVAARDAARAAAWDAAWAAAWVALTPTRLAQQQSALRLVARMIDCAEG